MARSAMGLEGALPRGQAWGCGGEAKIDGRAQPLPRSDPPHRAEYEWAPGQVDAILAAGADRARPIAHETLRRVYEAMGLE